MRFRITPGIFTTTFIMVVLACAFLQGGCRNKQDKPAPPPPEVGTMTVKEQEVVLTTELPGRTSAYMMAEVRPQVSGIIQKRLFTEGSDVLAGTVLYLIDPSPFQAAYDSAEASLARALANLQAVRLRSERYRELVATGAVSRQNFDDAESAYGQAVAEVDYWKAAVKSARINLDHTRLTAPISGRIGKSNVTEGALVTANQPSPLATILQLDPMYVDIPQSTAELLRLKKRIELGTLDRNGAGHNKVSLKLEDGTSYPLDGTLQFQDVTVERTTGSVIIRAVFPNPDGLLLPGMFVRGVAQEGINKKAILIPQHAVSRDPKGNPTALIVDDKGKVQQRYLTVDRAVGNHWLVTSGLVPDDRVIVEGMQKVKPGAEARAVSTEGKGPAGPAAGNTAQPAARKD